MILSELRKYISQQKRAALTDLHYHFDTEPEALRGMLSVLERKGWVKNCPQVPPVVAVAINAPLPV